MSSRRSSSTASVAPLKAKKKQQKAAQPKEEPTLDDADTPSTPDSPNVDDGSISCSIPYILDVGGVPVFRPSKEEFQQFANFIEQTNVTTTHNTTHTTTQQHTHMRTEALTQRGDISTTTLVGAHYGMIKVIPPSGYTPNKTQYKEKHPRDMMIQSPIRQHAVQVKGLPGAYRVFAIDEVSTRSISVNEFEEMSRAADEKRAPREKKLVEEKAWEDLERRFWSGCISNAPLYGADSPGTLFDTECEEWNVANLPSLLHAMPGEGVPGVSLPFLYFGQWKSMFSWHIEDVNLYSINYLHFGSPKQWYGIAPRDAARFERALGTIWPIEKGNCTEFIRHKEHLVSPTLLKERYGISVMRTRQMPGEFMVLWPQCYHQGFNYGFNCAESVNFATSWWSSNALSGCHRCLCRADTVWVQPKQIVEDWRKLQYLYREEEKEKDKNGTKKRTLTIDDVPTPASYQLDDQSIWLGLPTRPQDLRDLRLRYMPAESDDDDDDAPSGGRSMAGRSMTGGAGSSSAVGGDGSSSNGFLFDQSSYNEMDTGADEAGFVRDANVVFCTYPDCTQPLHRSQAGLINHYKTVHTAEARARSAAADNDKKRKSAAGVTTPTPAAVDDEAATKKAKIDTE